MKQLCAGLALLTAACLAGAPAEAQSCWKATAFGPPSGGVSATYQLTLVSQPCTSTPANHGWTQVYSDLNGNPISLELWVASPTSWNWDGCYILQAGELLMKPPKIYVQIVPGIECESASFFDTFEPPACRSTTVTLSGPTLLPIGGTGTYTASAVPAGYQYWWSTQYRHVNLGWFAYSTPVQGTNTRTAGSNTCDFDRMNVRVELRKTGCTGALGSAVKSTFFTMLGCF